LHGDSFIEGVNAGAVAISSTLATAAGWIGTAVAAGAKALDRLGNFQSEIDNAIKEGDKPVPILQSEQVLALRRKEVAIAESNLESASEAVQKADSELGDPPSIRLNRFIRDKIVDGDYAKHLGIIANVRRDFEELAEFMSKSQDADTVRREAKTLQAVYDDEVGRLGLDRLVSEGLLTPDERESIKAKPVVSREEIRTFHRIILYIDDLDRCPPNKVVQVLQACHLLLAFPLFIVVVAVDARWVSRALLKQYSGLIEFDQLGNGVSNEIDRDIGATASPRDYLEKIFQVPYWVRRMRGEASTAYAIELIGDVAEPEEVEVTHETEGTDETEPEETLEQSGKHEIERVEAVNADEGESRPEQLTESEGRGEGPGTEKEGPSAEQIEQADEIEGVSSEEGAEVEDSAETPSAEDEAEEIDPNPKGLLLEPAERDFLSQMAPYAGQSPRTVKRFVNVYRLLRTAIPSQELRALVGNKGESLSYRAIIAQLAIVTGAPTLADRYFEVLESTPSASGQTPTAIKEALRASVLEELHKKDSAQWLAVAGCLDALADIDDTKEMVAAMQEWSNVVKRYSFSARPYL